MGKISVIIPTHNRADLLPRAVRSVQNQTRAVDEIIIVSDGSTDNTEETVNALAEQDERIHLIAYHPGRNGNYARNRGIEAATGEFIAFLDDDDEWLPRKTELQMERLHKWYRQTNHLVVIEMGAGVHVPTVRRASESFNAPIIRINPDYPEVPKSSDIGLAMGALDALRLIEAQLEKTA